MRFGITILSISRTVGSDAYRLLFSGHKRTCFANGYRHLHASRHRDQLTSSYVSATSRHALCGETIGAMFLKQVDKTPDREMVVFPRTDFRMTFGEAKDQIDKLVSGLLALGLVPGDRVGIWAPNVPEWVITQFAAAQVGFILVNINPAYRVNELEYALNKVGVKCLIMAERFKTQMYYEMLFSICPELINADPGNLQLHRLPSLRSVIIASETPHPGTMLFKDVLAMDSPVYRSQAENISRKLHFDQPINIQFTSGTTGNPKGATLTHHNILNNSLFIGHRLDYDVRPPRICIPVPLYHCFGMVVGSLMNASHGSTCIYPSPSFEPEACLQAIQNERCDSLYGTPTMFIDILNHPNFSQYNFETLRSAIMAGSPCPVEVMKQVNSELQIPEACIAYGSTESSPVVFLTFPDDSIEKRCGTVGAPLDHTEAKLIDEEGNVVPIGEKGELCTRGYSTMLGYWDDETKTKSAISSTQWYHTGDVAIMDSDGYVTMAGRLKDMIIRGGENVYPVEIEQFLYTHPAIEDVQVIGVPDKRMGEEICAAIRVKEGFSLEEQELKDFCKGKISHFKIPRYVWIVEEYPLTVTGKVQKFVMREAAVKTLKLEHEAP